MRDHSRNSALLRLAHQPFCDSVSIYEDLRTETSQVNAVCVVVGDIGDLSLHVHLFFFCFPQKVKSETVG